MLAGGGTPMTDDAPKPPKPLTGAPAVLLAAARATPLGRGRGRRLVLGYLEKRVDHPIRTHFRGVPFAFELDNNTERKALFNRYDLEEIAFIAEGAAQPGAVFVDIGANVGFFTQMFLARAPRDARVLAIEPNPAMVRRLERNVALLRLGERRADLELMIESCAVGAADGEAHLDLALGLGSAHIAETASAGSLQVPVRPLADIVRRRGLERIDVLKIDVEGYEDRALVPFFEVAPAPLRPRRILMEDASKERWRDDLPGRLRALGYRETARTRGNVMLALD